VRIAPFSLTLTGWGAAPENSRCGLTNWQKNLFHKSDMPEPTSFHMTPDEFRHWGRTVVDWIADYQQRVESLPVLSQVQPGQIRAGLPASPPERGEPFDAIFGDLERVILPGITHWQSPNFFGFFPANGISSP